MLLCIYSNIKPRPQNGTHHYNFLSCWFNKNHMHCNWITLLPLLIIIHYIQKSMYTVQHRWPSSRLLAKLTTATHSELWSTELSLDRSRAEKSDSSSEASSLRIFSLAAVRHLSTCGFKETWCKKPPPFKPATF